MEVACGPGPVADGQESVELSSHWLRAAPPASFAQALKRLCLAGPPPGYQGPPFDGNEVYRERMELATECRLSTSLREPLTEDDLMTLVAYTMQGIVPLYPWVNAWLSARRDDPKVIETIGPFARCLAIAAKRCAENPDLQSIYVVAMASEINHDAQAGVPSSGAPTFWALANANAAESRTTVQSTEAAAVAAVAAANAMTPPTATATATATGGANANSPPAATRPQKKDPNAILKATDKDGATSLHCSAMNGHIEVVKLLVDKGCDVKAADNKGATPLHMAAGNGHIEVTRYLISRGASSRAPDKDGRTPLHWAARGGRLEVLRILLDKGAIKVVDRKNATLLHVAAAANQTDIAKLLIEKGADVKALDADGLDPLQYAAATDAVAAAVVLLEKGAPVNSVDGDGTTPLMTAAYKGHAAMVRFLVEHGGDLKHANVNGWTAKDVAKSAAAELIANVLASA